jgi:lysophospholipase L1-like esterase
MDGYLFKKLKEHTATLASIVRQDGLHIYNTDVGLRKWKATLAKLASGTNQIFNMSVMGDSISEGANASDYISKGYVGLLRTALQGKFGDVGKGFIPVHYPFSGKLWSWSANWNNNDDAMGATGSYLSTAANGETASINFSGTGFGLVFTKGSICGSVSVAIDGGEPVTINTNGAYTSAWAYEITGLTDGNHALVLTTSIAVDGSQRIYLLGGYEIKGTRGIRVNMVGKYGTQTLHSVRTDALRCEIDMWTPVLTIIAFTANDYSNNVDPNGAYKTNLQTMITRAKQFGDVMLVSVGLRSGTYTYQQQQYVDVMKSLAFANDCAFIDIFSKWGSDWDIPNDLGMMSDVVHPNDAGHQDIATAITQVLLGSETSSNSSSIAKIEVLTQAAYDVLPSSKSTDNILYLIKG